jgi:hypothetical protein
MRFLKKNPPHGKGRGEVHSPSTYSSTLGTRKADQGDHVGEIGWTEKEEDAVEELFRQLWAIPQISPPRVPNLGWTEDRLVWVRKELVKEDHVRPKNCFVVSHFHRVEGIPMAEHSRWVW